MRRHLSDEGYVIRKKSLLREDKLITIFSRNFGKIRTMAYGVRKITSRRLSHLETGNLIKFSVFEKNSNLVLAESEIISGYTKIKASSYKLQLLYLIFFILDRTLPENQTEPPIFQQTLRVLNNLSENSDFSLLDLRSYLSRILILMGFVDKKSTENTSFDSLNFFENLMKQKIAVPLYLD